MSTVARKQKATEGRNSDKFRGGKSSSVMRLYSEPYTAPVPGGGALSTRFAALLCQHCLPETNLVRRRAIAEKPLEPLRQQIAGFYFWVKLPPLSGFPDLDSVRNWDTKVRPSLTLRSEAVRMPSPPSLYYFCAWTDSGCLGGCEHFHLTVASVVACSSSAPAGSYAIAVEKGEYRVLNTKEEAEYQELMYEHAEARQAVILCWPKPNPEPAD